MKTPVSIRRAARLVFLLFPLSAWAQTQPRVIHLWPNGAPGFEGRKDIPEQAAEYWAKNINNPSITVYGPPKAKANGCAVVVFPGGGFKELVILPEGRDVADFLNPLGVTVFVVKYRLPNEPGSPYTLENVRQDAYRSIRLVRSRAAEFNVDPNRIGVLGFSAGGEVVSMVAFDEGDGDPAAADPVDRVNGRPNFEILVYPGGGVPEAVPSDTPPALLICANNDQYHCDEVTLELFQKFREAGVSVEAHFMAEGRHAFNMGQRSPYEVVREWPHRMSDWLADRGYLKPAGSQ
jgi:acetyl esterase/lipase